MTQIEMENLDTQFRNFHLADALKVGSWKNAGDAMSATFEFARRKCDLYPEVIAARSGIPKGTISGLVNRTARALLTHESRLPLMNTTGCGYLMQYEASKKGFALVPKAVNTAMVNEIKKLREENELLKRLLRENGIPIAPDESQDSRVDHGLFIAGSEA